MRELTLKDGKPVTLRDPEEVPERRRGAVADAAMAALPYAAELTVLQELMAGAEAGGTPGELDLARLSGQITTDNLLAVLRPIMNATILAFVKEWSYGPVDEATLLDELPGAVYDELRDLTLPMFSEIVPRFDVASAITEAADGTPTIDRSSPTPPSVG